MNTHIDTLGEWFENAEQGFVREGDTVIHRDLDDPGEYLVYVAGASYRTQHDHIRILARAPKPKPAWHDAVAVLANHRDYPDEERTVWTRELDPEQYDWADANGQFVAPHHLVNVTPLIEAKVTDEMVDLAWSASKKWEFGGVSKPAARAMLTAALGLETT